MINLIKKLTLADGTSGNEIRIADIIKNAAQSLQG